MPAQQYDWQEVVDLKPTGHMEWQYPVGETVFNGPLDWIWIDDLDFVHIHFKWLATMPYAGQPGFGKWKKADDDRLLEVIIPNFMAPFVIEDTPGKGRRVRFGFNILYFENRDNLDPQDVEGLELNENGRVAAAERRFREDSPAETEG